MILFIIVFAFCSVINAQMTGKSPTGSLRHKKEVKSENSRMQIILLEPSIKENGELTVETDILKIRGKVEDDFPLKALIINNQQLSFEDDNSFYTEYKLQNGVNEIKLTATDEQNNFKVFTCIINSIPKASGPKIIIIEPILDSNNEIKIKEKGILVKVKIMQSNETREVLINNKKANSIKKSEYFSNLKLQNGFNQVSVRVIGKNGKSTESSFRVIVESDKEGPKITIIEPAVSRGIKIVRKSETVAVKGKAEDNSGIYEVTINGIKTDLKPDGSFSLNMYLAMGENPLVVKALDNNLNATSDTFYVTRKLEDLLVAGKFYALLIGINSYEGYWPRLKSAVNDAKEVASVLREKYGFDSVITVLDRQANRKNIIQILEWMTDHLRKDDNLVIFYAGHGQFNKNLNRGFWVPSDATSNSIADYIPNGEIRTFMAGIPAKHILLITDACFGGDIFRGKTESYPFDPNNMEKYYREVYKRQSRLALTSGGIEEVRDDGKDGHSIFTYYLLKALKDNKNRYMDATQLYNELRIAVANNSDQTPILQAVKDTYDEGGQFIFVNRIPGD
ncbi:MAG: caspase family protein [Bacteroidota bacterium]|nr:caspase family protein [Bacteroidota bacterium]MDP4189950.1 caspase family protein [Bacteroidota bacterium]MDP4194493.1 caspase family protein [Bacteroidota bacterium]